MGTKPAIDPRYVDEIIHPSLQVAVHSSDKRAFGTISLSAWLNNKSPDKFDHLFKDGDTFEQAVKRYVQGLDGRYLAAQRACRSQGEIVIIFEAPKLSR